MDIKPIFLSVSEAKRALSVGHTTIYALMNSGALERVKCGGKTLITVESLERYAESLREAA